VQRLPYGRLRSPPGIEGHPNLEGGALTLVFLLEPFLLVFAPNRLPTLLLPGELLIVAQHDGIEKTSICFECTTLPPGVCVAVPILYPLFFP
jgi:hypothetical protein